MRVSDRKRGAREGEMRLKRTLTGAPAGIHPLMNIPVPWLFLLTFFAGVGLQHLLPFTIHSARVLLLSYVAGAALTVGGVLLAVSSLGLFRAARTTTIPFETASKLVTWGPYRFSRNPMYVSLTLTYLGVAGIQAQIWPLLLLPWTVAYLHRTVIPFEEARLQDVFGDAYERYSQRVRRWL
jgi:protein-S-isoprenylcysteine O-methyltransferase Ste14